MLRRRDEHFRRRMPPSCVRDGISAIRLTPNPLNKAKETIMTTVRALAGLLVTASLAAAVPAHADPVSDWNAVTMLYVVGNPPAVPVGRGGPPGLLDIALVHAAVHDAVQAIEGRFRPYS